MTLNTRGGIDADKNWYVSYSAHRIAIPLAASTASALPPSNQPRRFEEREFVVFEKTAVPAVALRAEERPPLESYRRLAHDAPGDKSQLGFAKRVGFVFGEYLEKPR